MGKFKELTDSEKIITFSKLVYEYFQTNYLHIHDFLTRKTAWDTYFEYELDIDQEELNEAKNNFLCSATASYLNYVINKTKAGGVSQTEAYFLKKIGLVTSDIKEFEDSIKEQKLWQSKLYKKCLETFSDDELIQKKIYDFFLNCERKKTKNSVKVNSTNRYFYELDQIVTIYDTLYIQLIEIVNELEDYEDIANQSLVFYTQLEQSIFNFLNYIFNNHQEYEEFVNYLYSYVYGYLYMTKDIWQNDSKCAIENSDLLGIMSIVEEEIPPVSNFTLENISLTGALLDTLYEIYNLDAFKKDYRITIKDNNIKSIIKKLDPNYGSIFPQGIIIYDGGIDKSLETMLETLQEELDYQSLAQLLLDNSSIYYLLLDNGMDARQDVFFKNAMIRKILGDVYLFECHNTSLEETLHATNLEKLIKPNSTTSVTLNNYFAYYSDSILEEYYEYQKLSSKEKNAALKRIIETDKIKVIEQINPHFNLGQNSYDLNEINSVIYMQKALALTRGFSINELFNQDKDEYHKLINAICLNVYEHILLEPSQSENLMDIKRFIETESDLDNYLTQNLNLLQQLIYLLHYYNKEGLNSKDELNLRMKISNNKQVKVLERLNVFDQNNKKQ